MHLRDAGGPMKPSHEACAKYVPKFAQLRSLPARGKTPVRPARRQGLRCAAATPANIRSWPMSGRDPWLGAVLVVASALRPLGSGDATERGRKRDLRSW